MASAINASGATLQGRLLMDTYCILRGTLLDNADLRTLEHPDKHSVHCVVDVPLCYESGFEVLQDPPADDSTKFYCRALKLDAKGNAMALALARELGEKFEGKDGCRTCTAGEGTLRRGFRATVIGKLDPNGDGNFPRKIITDKILRHMLDVRVIIVVQLFLK